MDLTRPMRQAAENLLHWPNPKLGFMLAGGFGIAHDTGRWWDALLRYERVSDFSIPGDIEAAMLRNLKILADNPDGFLFTPPKLDGIPSGRFEVHSLREGLLAFTGLIRHRHNAWASEAAPQMLATVKRILRPDGTIDTSRLAYFRYATVFDLQNVTHATLNGTDYTAVTGRFIEALVWHYEETRDPLALELARVFADYHMEHTVNADGSRREEVFSDRNWGHSHSYLGTLRGLLLFGLLMGERRYIDAVAATYRNAVSRHVITESGRVAHDLGRATALDDLGNPVAECTSAGDAAQIALWLAERDDQPDLYDDVERIVRARVLPAQIVASDTIDNANMAVPALNIGGWGGCEYPYSTKGCCAPDYVAAALHTLVDVASRIVTRSAAETRVNLHFDFKDDTLRVVGRRHADAELTVEVRIPGNLLIRVPGWAPADSLRLTVNGAECPVRRAGAFVFVPREALRPVSTVVLRHALPLRRTAETTRVGHTYTFAWKGDEIIGIAPNEGPRPFYPALKE